MRELVKDLENLKGDLAQNYRTIPVVYGENISKRMLTLLGFFTLVPIKLLITKFETGYMYYFFYGSIIALIIFLIILWKSQSKLHYIILHTILKFIILIGVFSIVLIDTDVLLNRIL